ncbi:hypothetical protein HYDPIDRAFT_169373 [Hydnomerulius pinastri MD-312]|uniref:Uncharacterized protein n=1 Tax=Hydnomerulius pinastri MD-312 TaxID=994086 RepID=A0A0C9V8G8_9AGAM|nr:hypothetical protein HYDPIDRAFT_169373 [Hydnomerulius pinastri MD-312]
MSANDEGHNDLVNDTRGRYSIDLTLELEHQLDNESLPPSSPADAERPQSLDPHVLASIITQLRMSLAQASRERDEFKQSLLEMQAREADITDTLAHMTDKCSKLQEEVDTANNKSKDDENTISVLRTKVEESRRGLMRLQSESRRASQVPSGLDLSRAGMPTLGGPPSSKRASFAPLTGSAASRISAHRRISSVSDTGFSRLDGSSPHPSPSPGNFTFPDNSMQFSKTHQPAHSRRMSGMFGRASPPPSIFASEESVEVEMLRKELNSLRSELDEAKHELSESNEAREASELCVKALRGFIEENNVGTPMSSAGPSTARAPSLSLASPSSQGEAKKSAPATGGWGFKLWRAETPARSPAPGTPVMPATPPAAVPNPISSPPPQPLTRKLGDFFGARTGSISSTAPSVQPLRVEQEAMYNGMSDTSSVEESLAEPISPASELPRQSVLVKDTTSVTSGSSTRDLGGSPEGKTLPSPLGVEGVLTSVAI